MAAAAAAAAAASALVDTCDATVRFKIAKCLERLGKLDQAIEELSQVRERVGAAHAWHG